VVGREPSREVWLQARRAEARDDLAQQDVVLEDAAAQGDLLQPRLAANTPADLDGYGGDRSMEAHGDRRRRHARGALTVDSPDRRARVDDPAVAVVFDFEGIAPFRRWVRPGLQLHRGLALVL